MTAVDVAHLVKRYRGARRNAVDDISFDVPEGQLFCLLGPNGAGKTTTVSVLTTTLAPTSGRVLIAGRDLATEQAKVRREIGIVFQQPSLDLNLSAEENIRLREQLKAAALALARERVRQLPATADLDRSEVVLLQRLLSPEYGGPSYGGPSYEGPEFSATSDADGLADARSLLS